MNRPLTKSELEKITAQIVTQMGLHFPPSKWQNLEQILRTAAKELGFNDVKECVARLIMAPPSNEFIAALAPYLTIGETYFFRETKCFEIFEKKIIPEIINKRRGKNQRLRIWSAGCATGEEAYSIAILLDKMRDTLRDWKISILATDINPQSLGKAKEGIYTNWALRSTPPDFQKNYFRETEDGRFALLPKIKEMVTFSSLNLIDDFYPFNNVDAIFCRNVLMYFTPALAKKVVEQFHRSLSDDGSLFVSPCETSCPFFSGFAPTSLHGATFYQKIGDWHAVKPTDMEVNVLTPRQSAPYFPSCAAKEIQVVPAPLIAGDGVISPPTPLPESDDETSAYQEALILYEQGAYQKAAERVLSQLTQDNNDIRALTLLVRIYANEGRRSEALALSDQALATVPHSAELHYLRAIILQEHGLDREAVTSLKKALYLKQDLVMAHFTLANIKKRMGMIKKSRLHFDHALSHLDRYHPDKVIPESDGMLAGRLKEIILVTIARI